MKDYLKNKYVQDFSKLSILKKYDESIFWLEFVEEKNKVRKIYGDDYEFFDNGLLQDYLIKN